MGFTITAHPYFPAVSPEPGKLRRGGRSRGTSRSRIKTSDLKYMAMGVGKGVAKASVHLDLACGLGNMGMAVPADYYRFFQGRGLALFPR